MRNLPQTDRVYDLVAEALERAPEERAAFLRQACGEDETLRAEVGSLLGHEAGAQEFLNAPASAETAAKLFAADEGELKPEIFSAIAR